MVPLEKLKHIRLLLLDVDGVLTDGGIIYNEDGGEIKIFNAKDGLGLRLAMTAGITVGIVTGRRSKALRHRCENLGIRYLFDGVGDKAKMLPEIVAQTGIGPEQAAFVGDDLPDLPLMKRVGLAIAVADANGIVRQRAAWTTKAPGGHGAVREVCEALLTAQGLWEEIIARY
jgi:3-deoxy-D-manno-octulosonate 8-phosphate phosphatase (KDO 8-P phosphatase)